MPTKEKKFPVGHDISQSGRYEIAHHTHSSTIELCVMDDDGFKENCLWFDYYEWKEFTDFIKKLTDADN